MTTEELKALQNLGKVFPQMQVGHDEDGLLVIYTNIQPKDWDSIWNEYEEVITCTMDNK